jgi:Flp pilus assembly protein TadB
MTDHPMQRLSATESPRTRSLWKSAVLGVVRLAVALVAVVVMLGVLLMGLLLAMGLVVWSLLRGRRPAQGLFSTSFRRARQRSPWAEGTVIDIEAREVPEPHKPEERR